MPPMEKLSRKEQEILWLVAIPLAALGLRLYLLGKQSLWYDEGVTWYVSSMSLPELLRWTAADIQPPLYYLVTRFFIRLLGESEYALRFPAALFGVLLVPVTWRLARRLFGRETAFITAVIAAAGPVMVYYSQEARMYTLLALESALATWLLLRVLHGPDAPPAEPARAPLARSPYLPAAGYTLVAAAALYTHYFAAWLLLAHGLYFLHQLIRQRWPRALVFQGGGIALGVTLLFAPWLPTLLARWGDDPSYWPGALKLNEVGRKVLLSFTLGGAPEMVFEERALPRLLALSLLFLLCLALFLYRRPAEAGLPRASRNLLLLLWLILPPVLVILLSYQTPKFNPRYTLLAWPAFALILGGGLGFDLKQVGAGWLRQGLTLVLFAALAFVAYAWYLSLANWFTEPRFSKADFRSVAQFIRERSRPDETVLLSSGHLFPVWAYYYGWEGWTPLPEMERLDVNRVTGFEIGGALRQALDGRGGAWLVTWQDEVVDPNGVVPFLLDRVGRRPVDAGDFWGVGLEHWRLEDVAALSAEPPIDRPLSVNFGDQVELLGFSQVPGSSAEVMLFWRARAPLPDDLQAGLRLLDAEGHCWSEDGALQPLAAYTFPPSRWPPGQVVPGRLRLPWLVGTPPGDYALEVELLRPSGPALDVLDAQGRPQRRSAWLSPVALDSAVQPPGAPPPLPATFLAGWESTVVLRESALSKTELQQGEPFALNLLWQAGEFPLDDLNLSLRLRDSRGVPHVGDLVRAGARPSPAELGAAATLARPVLAAGAGRSRAGSGGADRPSGQRGHGLVLRGGVPRGRCADSGRRAHVRAGRDAGPAPRRGFRGRRDPARRRPGTAAAETGAVPAGDPLLARRSGAGHGLHRLRPPAGRGRDGPGQRRPRPAPPDHGLAGGGSGGRHLQPAAPRRSCAGPLPGRSGALQRRRPGLPPPGPAEQR